METSETTCRICSDDEENNVLIFGEEGIRLNIQLKIRKYLYFNVSSEDDLPKIVCINCCNKLNAIHRFAMKALKIQSQFREQFYKSVESDVKTNNGLLHSYLLQGKNEQYEQDITEMEVKVDPSLFLQCIVDENEDTSSDYDEDSQLEMDDCSSHVVSNRIFSNETSSFSEDIKKIPPDTQITLTDSCPNKNFNSKKIHNSEPLVLSSTIKTSTDVDVIIKSQSDIKNEQLVNITKDLLCLICQLKFSNECELQNHLFVHLKSDSDKTCSDNDFLSTFDMLNMLKIDTTNSSLLSKDNSDEVTVSCPICKKNNFTKTNLKIHIEIHRPKGRHACNICGRIFKTEINLLRHKEYHDGIQFPCNVCGRVYPTKSTLRAHSITHSDLRPHKCTLCNKTFKRNQDLKFHLNQHTGARPYQCLYCPKAFASSGNCFSHRKRMHSNEVERDRERIAEYVK